MRASSLVSRVLLLLGFAAGPEAAAAPDAPALPWAADVAVLLDGVKEIGVPGVPGTLAVWGDDAFPVLLGTADRHLQPVVAAAQWGKGRVVAFSHDSYASTATASVADTGRLLQNSLRWLATGVRKDAAPRVGCIGSDLGVWAKAYGFDARILQKDAVRDDLASLDVLVLADTNIDEGGVKAVASFVARGGGLFVAQTAWGWLQLNPGKTLRDNPLVRLLAPAGLGWTANTTEKPPRGRFANRPVLLAHAGRAVDVLVASAKSASPSTGMNLDHAAAVVTEALTVVPASDTAIRPRLEALLAERTERLAPTEKEPFDAKRALDRALLALDLASRRDRNPHDTKAHPASAAFPGAAPKEARRFDRVASIDPKVSGWRGTGVYAVAGEVVTATVPASVAKTGLRLRIGCHGDTLWHLASWPRAPDVSREWPISGVKTEAASAFGGLVYVVVPERAGGKPFEVRIAGGIEAPRYVLGETKAEEWAAIRGRPAPWAELETSKVILSVPSKHVRDLGAPEALMRFWDRVLDADADLAGIPRELARPERIVADVEISAGYMHSGYPVMTHMDAAARMTDLPTMERGDWGLFHELGHNHQQPEWTFEGTTEVTCNLFTLYVLETVCGKKDPTEGHDAFENRAKRAKAHVEKGVPFADWKADPFLALYSYVDLIEAFGWEPFRKVFAEYRALPAAERPKTDDDKRDQWLVRMSRATGKNLGPFFQAWGIPTSDAARDSVQDLPAWMPKGFPGR